MVRWLAWLVAALALASLVGYALSSRRGTGEASSSSPMANPASFGEVAQRAEAPPSDEPQRPPASLPSARTPVTSERKSAASEARELRLELPTRDDTRFFGRALAFESDEALAGASVELWSRGFLARRGSTDAAGRFELPVSSWRNAKVRVSA